MKTRFLTSHSHTSRAAAPDGGQSGISVSFVRLPLLLFGLVLCLGSLLSGCGGGGASKHDKYNARIAVDETVRPIVEKALEAFAQNYPRHKITPIFTTENEALKALLADSVRLAIVPRQFSEEELAKFREEHKFTPKMTEVARDGIVGIVHPMNVDTQLTWQELQDILRGETQDWRDVGDPRFRGSIQVIFDDGNSSLVRYMRDSVLNGDTLAWNVYAKGSNPKVIEYVSRNPNAIGFIGYNWLSDGNDPRVKALHDSVRMVAFSPPDKPGTYARLDSFIHYKLIRGKYPLKRSIYVINRESMMGAASMFTSYLAGKDGQLIIHKSNLVPALSIMREVELKEGEEPEVTSDEATP